MKNTKKKIYLLFATLILVLAVVFVLFIAAPDNAFTAEAASSPNSTDGRQIDNATKLATMAFFPEHDGINGCGMVAMGILLQFYTDLNIFSDGRYIPGNMYYDSNPYSTGEVKVSRANLLRDDLCNRTPKFLGTIGEWVGVQNATISSGHAAGLNSYFDEYYPELDINAYYAQNFPSENAIINLLDSGKPVILTLISFKYYSYGGTLLEPDKEKYHCVVAYGYRYVDGETQYLCHLGWDPDDSTNISTNANAIIPGTANVWVTPSDYALDPFIYGYCYIDAPVSKFNTATTSEGSYIITGFRDNVDSNLIIPEEINGTPVTGVGEWAFYDNDAITSISIGSNVTHIDEMAFYKCESVTSLSLPTGLEIIGEGAFSYLDIQTLGIPMTVTQLDADAFAWCRSLTSVTTYHGLQTIGERAFFYCDALTSFYIPSSVTTIGQMAFCITALSGSLTVPDSVTRLEYGTFALCSIEKISLPDTLTYIGDLAFYYCGNLTDINIPSGVTQIGLSAFAFCDDLTSLTLNASCQTGIDAFKDCSNLTIYTAASAVTSSSNPSERPVVYSCNLNAAGNVASFTKTSNNPTTLTGIQNPSGHGTGYNFGGWFTTSDFSGTQYLNLSSAPIGTLYAKWSSSSSCVAEGTLITLADGSLKAVEDLTGNEELLVWNLLTGNFDTAPILFIDSDPESVYEVIKLTFSDGTVVEVIDEHAFWDFDLNKYVFLRADASQYIGHWFNKQTTDDNNNLIWTEAQLISVNIVEKTTSSWSPVTYGHLCYYVNGMLSMPGATEGLINIFEVDPETLSYDEEAMEEDIETYGLFTYAEFSELFPVSQTIFNAFNAQYLKVAIGKGLITLEEIGNLIELYSEFF